MGSVTWNTSGISKHSTVNSGCDLRILPKSRTEPEDALPKKPEIQSFICKLGSVPQDMNISTSLPTNAKMAAAITLLKIKHYSDVTPAIISARTVMALPKLIVWSATLMIIATKVPRENVSVSRVFSTTSMIQVAHHVQLYFLCAKDANTTLTSTMETKLVPTPRSMRVLNAKMEYSMIVTIISVFHLSHVTRQITALSIRPPIHVRIASSKDAHSASH